MDQVDLVLGIRWIAAAARGARPLPMKFDRRELPLLEELLE